MIADLGEFRGLDLDERSAGEGGQSPGDFSFTHAGRPDHNDVLGRDILANRLGELLAAPAIADGDGHGPLGVGLADDVMIEFGDDLARGEGLHFMV